MKPSKPFFLRMMCALMIALWTSGARAQEQEGRALTALAFDLNFDPATTGTIAVVYNNAIDGTSGGQLTGNTLALTASRVYFSPSANSRSTDNLSLTLTGSKDIGTGDVFTVGTEVPSAQFRVFGAGARPTRPTYRAVSGQVSVISKTGSALTLRLDNVVLLQSASQNPGSATCNGTISAAFTIPNSAPTEILLSNSDIVEKQRVGTDVGTLSATDADAGDSLAYALVAGAGDSDNALFSIDGDTLRATQTFDFATKSAYSIRVRVTDKVGESFEKSFIVQVVAIPPGNRAPIAGNTFIDTYVNTSVVKGLLGSDRDGDALTFRIVNNARYGTSEIKRDSDGQFRLFYTSLNRFYGDDRVTYLAVDRYGKESNVATVGIKFINRSPVALGNFVQVASGELVSQFLFADDPDLDAITYRLVNNPRFGKGEIKLDPQGKWRFFYQSLPRYVGPDRITFIAIDAFGKESSVATIDINVVRVSSISASARTGGGDGPSGGGS